MNNTQPVQPTLTHDQEQTARVAAQDSVLRCLIEVLKPEQSALFARLINGSAESLSQLPAPEDQSQALQRQFAIHLLKSYLPQT